MTHTIFDFIETLKAPGDGIPCQKCGELVNDKVNGHIWYEFDRYKAICSKCNTEDEKHT